MQQVEIKQTSLSSLRHVALLSAKRAPLLCCKESLCQPGSCVAVGFGFHSQRLTAAMQTENHGTLILVGSRTWTTAKEKMYLDCVCP